ncbi:MAG: YifB family Mg chelatase-like AAA ATPase [Proteocatella sp.]
MFYKNYTCALEGIQGYTVDVEADISKGIPNFTIVGLPDVSVRESRERIRAAITNSGLKFPGKKIIINLSPSDIRKEGSHFDLPIGLCILNSEYDFLKSNYLNSAFLGELSLNGEITAVKGIIPFVINAKNDNRINRVFIPHDNIREVEFIEGIDIFPVKNLMDIVKHLCGKSKIDKLTVKEAEYIPGFDNDYIDIKGNLVAKRAAEICASGWHNLLFIGSAGSGKTMVAKRLPSIIGPLDKEEHLEVSSIYSSAGIFDDSIMKKIRPFRSPHHTSTIKSLIGGGASSSPGEVVLAHNGILFLDEVLEFDKRALEALRQPIEDKYVTISRVRKTNRYPSNFLLVACCNPCPCGNFNNPDKECKCSEGRIKAYLSKASGPLLDRFDVFVEMHPCDMTDILEDNLSEDSETIRSRVKNAQDIQRKRFFKENILFNDEITPDMLGKYCEMTKEAKALLDMVFKKRQLSVRSYHKLLKVARTIADLDGSSKIELNHISEAILFRKPLEKYWG